MPSAVRVAHEHERAGGGVDILSVHGEDRVPAHHREQLLMAVGELGLVVALVVGLHHLVARVPRDPVHAERPDVEVPAHQMEVARARTLAIGRVRVIRVDVRRQGDLGQRHGAEGRCAWIGHRPNLAGHRAEVNLAIAAARALHPMP